MEESEGKRKSGMRERENRKREMMREWKIEN